MAPSGLSVAEAFDPVWARETGRLMVEEKTDDRPVLERTVRRRSNGSGANGPSPAPLLDLRGLIVGAILVVLYVALR
jgi:hypothetical protein